jgi:hypothetical protein
MRASIRCLALLLPLASLTCCNASDADKVSDTNAQRLMLNQGYSMLYTDASRVQFTKLILYVKVESDAVNTLVTAISDHSNVLEKDLERIAREYPAVRIDLDPLPEMEKRKRSDVNEQRALSFAPFVGRTGRSFERTLLLSMSAVLSQESHLCKVMAAEEPDPGLKQFLIESHRDFEGLYGRVVALLDREYFTGGTTVSGKT